MNRAIRRRLFGSVTLAGAVAGVLAACTTTQQAQATSTTVQVVAWLQQSETALETLIAMDVPAASQAAAEEALQDFTTAATAVGAFISNSSPAATVAAAVQKAVGLLNTAVTTIGPKLPPKAQATLDAITLAANLLASFASSTLGTPPPAPVSITGRSYRNFSPASMTVIVPSK